MTAKSNKPTAPPPPEQWPAVVVEEYDPVRRLGKGGFASVMLARRKKSIKGRDPLVAMKIVGGRNVTAKEVGYAHREIDILKELNHSNIVGLLDWWEPAPEEHKCAAVMALSYIRGPTLEFILKRVGAPALNFCHIISAQLVDVVAFLHGHAVLHRDIKPDNLIITGVSLEQDELYEDSEDEPNWDELRHKWHLTLIDFGFARSLGPDDVKTDIGLHKSIHKGESGTLDKSLHSLDKSLHEKMIDIPPEENKSTSPRRTLDRSSSRVIVRKMSALGNKYYAAPEVQSRVKDTNIDKSTTRKPKTTLSNFVSDYGMVSDAFSVAQTMRYILTGVPPFENIDEAIFAQKNPINKAGRFIADLFSKSKQVQKRPKVYRKIKRCPPEAVQLVLGMSNRNPNDRTTVRSARLYPWIDDVLESTDRPVLRDLEFLQCAQTES